MSREDNINTPADLPPEYDGWNWGAFLLNWIWGIRNSTYIAFLMFVPIVNIVMIFMLGAKGSRWAWKNHYWRDLEHFRTTQRKWALAGVIVWATMLALAIALQLLLSTLMKNSEAYMLAMRELQTDERLVQALGSPIESGFWVTGSIRIQWRDGFANLEIPVSGPRGAGTAYVIAAKQFSMWSLRFLSVHVDGTPTPIILIDKRSQPERRARG